MHRLEDLDVHLFLVGEVKLTSIGGELVGQTQVTFYLFVYLFL